MFQNIAFFLTEREQNHLIIIIESGGTFSALNYEKPFNGNREPCEKV